MTDVATGIVKLSKIEKGFGFIKPDDGGSDVFVHVSAAERSGIPTPLQQGMRLGYDTETDREDGQAARDEFAAAVTRPSQVRSQSDVPAGLIVGSKDRGTGRGISMTGGPYVDLETVALLHEALEDAWGCVQLKDRERFTRSLLAERILKAAARGEGDRERLVDAALQAELAA